MTTSLCGVKADYWPGEEEVRSMLNCRTCEKRRAKVDRGEDDELEPWQVN